LFKASEAI